MSKALNQRIEVIDVLRGYAVMAIMLIHNIEHFNYYHYPDKSINPDWLNTLNAEVFHWMFFFFGGKTYSIFALLFGFTFYLMYQKQKDKGIDFGPRYLWRLLLLLGFAQFNAAFFPGEVLLLYAVCGVSLFFMRNLSNKSLLFFAIFFLAQPYEILHFIYAQFVPSYEVGGQLYSPLWKSSMDIIKNGTFLETIKGNLTYGQGFSFLWAVENGRAEQTIGLFTLGFWMGKKGYFKNEFLTGWKKVLVISVVTMIPLLYLKDIFLTKQEVLLVKRTVGVIFDMWWKLSFTFIWISLIVLLYQFKPVQKTTKVVKTYGRMSLTNYITQSIFGGIIYFGFGFHLADTCGVAFSLLIGFVFLFFQMLFCHLWLKKNKQGPFEMLWHKWTWAPSIFTKEIDEKPHLEEKAV
ncbi:DUF418 domain-containing protein [Flammeovirga yaeyamensis]|uniref:DUF418 domain-containing protein n=1 Tax=Flammeovirga yaeyamensis TaxID=367791 RepID=A0AAX1N4J8_9BACT|nr:DUF418 domain-containing protein [Flammeovirga yaeyamensis]MBB3700363.1 uncharacterized protein [Flammeovirga yaeyamensis]QWG02446.1 DUF418 domain-containing protein [Flammeovirga yaeyamensis]